MATSSTNKIKGLWTFPNYLSSNPEGSLEIAENVVIDADDTLEPRRGQKIVATLPENASQLMQYRSTILPVTASSVGFIDGNDPANLTKFQTKVDVKVVTADVIYKLDHGLSVSDVIYFEKKQDYSQLPNIVYFPLPSGLNNYSTFYVQSVIDKDTFKVSATPVGAAISIGLGQALLVFDSKVSQLETGLRTKYLESNGNLYFTSSDGIKKISALDKDSLSLAGGIQALNLELDLNLTTGGFFGPIPSIDNVEVSYRMVWGTKDINGNLILGPPSQIATLANYTKRSGTVDLTFTVPRGITRDYFYQIYRTRVSATGESGDEQKLIIEAPFDGYSTTITVNDNTADSIRDANTPLYSNETSGQGAFQINTKPPVAKDLALYKNRVFYANTQTTQKLDLTFLGFDGIQEALLVSSHSGSGVSSTLIVGSGHGIQEGDTVALANTTSVDGQYVVTAVGLNSITIPVDDSLIGAEAFIYRSYVQFSTENRSDKYFFVGRPEKYELVASPAASVTGGDYFYLTNLDDKIKYYFWFKTVSGGVDPLLPNKVGVMVDLETAPVPVTAEEVAVRIQAAIESVDDFVVEVDTILPEKLYIRTATSGRVTDVLSGTQVGTSLSSITNTQKGFGEDALNQFIRYSTYLSPAQAIEDTSKSLVRVVNQDDTNPVYAVYLSTSTTLPGQINFEERVFSNTSFTVTANNAAVAGLFNPDISSGVSSSQSVSPNKVYFSKFQQPEAVPSVNSIEVGPKNKAILRVLGLRDSLFILKEEGIYILTGESEANFSVRLFDNSGALIAPDSAVILNNQIYCVTTQGIATVSENGGLQIISRNIENIVSKITSEDYTNFYYNTFGVAYETDRAYLLYTIENSTDVTPTVCYRYNTFTQTFTKLLTPAICGVVQESKNKLFIGSVDGPTIETERKKLTSRDFADREYTRQVSDIQFKKMFIDSAALIEVGDVLTQKQWLKTTEFNALIKQLKMDPTLNFPQNFPELSVSGTADISLGMLNLIGQLNLKDQSLLTVQFDSKDDVDSSLNTITAFNHGLLEGDTVFISGSVLPTPVVSGNYTITQPTTNTFKLRPTSFQPLTSVGAGYGVLTGLNVVVNFNLLREIDYDSSYILVQNSGLKNGDVVVFTSTDTPPTGLVSGSSYEVVDGTTYGFRLKLMELDLTAAATSYLATAKEIYYATGTSDNSQAQIEFNTIVDKLNNSEVTDAQLSANPNMTYPFITTYMPSVGFEEIDYIVNSSSPSQNFVVCENYAMLQLGNITHYKSINSRAVWNYFTLGDPAMLKHVRSGSFMIKNNNLHTISVGYATDLSGYFEDILFKLDRSGVWGASFFGSSPWGGEGIAYPLRTLIPKQKQRCRYIKPQVIHSTAFRKFTVLGVSFDFETTSEKTSRK